MQKKFLEIITKHLKEIKEYKGKKIFFVDEEGFFELWNIKEKRIKELIEEGFNEKEAKKRATKGVFKIINPLKAPIKVVGFGENAQYSSVKDQLKIHTKYFEDEFQKEKNKIYREMNKKKKKAKTEKEKQDIENFYINRLNALTEIVEDIKSNPTKYELFFTTYLQVKKLKRPIIYFDYVKNNKIIHTHSNLVKDVPNIVYEGYLNLPKKEKDLIVEQRLSTMKQLFGKIFYRKKSENLL
jgi:hypothetical protein